MQVEELTKEKVSALNETDIKKLKDRFKQIYEATEKWKESFNKSKMGINKPIHKGEFFQKYSILFDEIQKRKIETNQCGLDVEMSKRNIQGINSGYHEPIIIDEDVLMINSSFSKNADSDGIAKYCITTNIAPEVIEVVENQLGKITNSKVEKIEKLKNKDVVISLYDLVLYPKDVTSFKKISIKEEDQKDNDDDLIVEFDKSSDNVEFVKSTDQRLVGGVVYDVDTPDADGDYVGTKEEIWGAMESFMLSGAKIRFEHGRRNQNVSVVESFQTDKPTEKAGKIIPAGSWYMTAKVHSDRLWEKIKNDEITGFSMAGLAKRVAEKN